MIKYSVSVTADLEISGKLFIIITNDDDDDSWEIDDDDGRALSICSNICSSGWAI